eukprot:1159061-Pelagomonas_calceolata.AAC.4
MCCQADWGPNVVPLPAWTHQDLWTACCSGAPWCSCPSLDLLVPPAHPTRATRHHAVIPDAQPCQCHQLGFQLSGQQALWGTGRWRSGGLQWLGCEVVYPGIGRWRSGGLLWLGCEVVYPGIGWWRTVEVAREHGALGVA